MSDELGAMLVKAGKITQEQLSEAQALVKNKKQKLEQALIQIGAISAEDEITTFVGKQLNMGTLRLADIVMADTERNLDLLCAISGDSGYRE